MNIEEVKKLLEEGIKLLKEKKLDEAEKKFIEAKDKAPDLAEPYIALGHLYIDKKEINLAKENYEKAIEKRPTSEVYNNLGTIYFLQGNIEKAEEAFNLSIALDENNLEPKKNLADMYYQIGKYEEAIPIYESVLEKQPSTDLLLSLANCYFKLGYYESAKYGYEKVLEFDKDNEIAKENLEFVKKKLEEKSQ